MLVYQTAGDEIADAVLTHTDKRGKFFTLVLQPPKRVRKQQIVPKEIIFAIDKSGSMRGFPIETAKKAMQLCIEGAPRERHVQPDLFRRRHELLLSRNPCPTPTGIAAQAWTSSTVSQGAAARK